MCMHAHHILPEPRHLIVTTVTHYTGNEYTNSMRPFIMFHNQCQPPVKPRHLIVTTKSHYTGNEYTNSMRRFTMFHNQCQPLVLQFHHFRHPSIGNSMSVFWKKTNSTAARFNNIKLYINYMAQYIYIGVRLSVPMQ